jgi:hypothetical protein
MVLDAREASPLPASLTAEGATGGTRAATKPAPRKKLFKRE